MTRAVAHVPFGSWVAVVTGDVAGLPRLILRLAAAPAARRAFAKLMGVQAVRLPARAQVLAAARIAAAST